MTADELDEIRHRSASCYVGTPGHSAIIDVINLTAALDAVLFQIREYQAAVRKCDGCCACLTFSARWKALGRGAAGPKCDECDKDSTVCECIEKPLDPLPRCNSYWDGNKCEGSIGHDGKHSWMGWSWTVSPPPI